MCVLVIIIITKHWYHNNSDKIGFGYDRPFSEQNHFIWTFSEYGQTFEGIYLVIGLKANKHLMAIASCS